jgi:hypothetical protein
LEEDTPRLRCTSGDGDFLALVTIDGDGEPETFQVDEDWLKKERKRIEDEYTFSINNFGRVILFNDRDAFDKETRRFQSIVEKYQVAVRDALLAKQSDFEMRIVDEFARRWEQNPPKRFSRWSIEPSPENIRVALQQLAKEMFDKAVTFDAPVVKCLYKNIALERNPITLRHILRRRSSWSIRSV